MLPEFKKCDITNHQDFSSKNLEKYARDCISILYFIFPLSIYHYLM